MIILDEAEYCNETGRKLKPAIGECNNCQHSVELSSGWANQCEVCGTEYNGSGQELRPRCEWGEETGELGQF